MPPRGAVPVREKAGKDGSERAKVGYCCSNCGKRWKDERSAIPMTECVFCGAEGTVGIMPRDGGREA